MVSGLNDDSRGTRNISPSISSLHVDFEVLIYMMENRVHENSTTFKYNFQTVFN